MKIFLLVLALALSALALAAQPPPPPGSEITPPRLSFIDGSVSFWRPGAEDWAPAQDACGAWMRREHFGHEASEFGWKIERVAPGARRTAP
jgi:hypothetical protein